LERREGLRLARAQSHYPGLWQFAALTLQIQQLFIQQTLMRGVLIQHQESLWTTGEDEGLVDLPQWLQSHAVIRYGRTAVGWHDFSHLGSV
jgi:hypothetical protein